MLALTRRNSNVTAIFVFLEKLVEVMREYFGQLEEVRREWELVTPPERLRDSA